ncbi:hypothetical protein [Glutamicibacter sp. NPDC087344]|uniref:hypothetical protein n=1 Tax=Glutamicibacter sp. NPDC087344 TaxID=3363994 RepID=UPI003808C349
MNSMQTLADLIKSVQEKNGWSDRDLGRRAAKLDTDITTSDFSRLKNRELVSVTGSLIRKLALVLMVSEQKVAQAALVSMGLDLEIPEVTVEDAVRNSPEFSIRDQALIMGLVSAMRDGESGTDEQQSRADPVNTPPQLPAVASASDPRPGQKTEPEGYGITEIHGAEAEKYPAPPLEQLAAHPKVKTKREQHDEQTGEHDENCEDDE